MSQSLRIIFAGTSILQRVISMRCCRLGTRIAGVFTQPDRPAGRGKIAARPGKGSCTGAQSAGVPACPLRPQENQQLVASECRCHGRRSLRIDSAQSSTGYMPRLGCINVHGSLLPRFRGAAPIQRLTWAGDAEPASPSCRWMSVWIPEICCITSPADLCARYQRQSVATSWQNSPTRVAGNVNSARKRLDSAGSPDEALVTYAEKLSKEEAPH